MDKTKTRKPHRKSRNGCLPCKARHVKCDEQKPACVNCDKYGSKCEYPQPKKQSLSYESPYPANTSTPSSMEISPTTPAVIEAAAVPETNGIHDQEWTLNISHLRLLHHFSTVTAKTLAWEPECEIVFSSYIVNMAFDYPFLLHAILALSALHLNRLDLSKRREYLHQAEQHHDIALTKFRAEVKEIDVYNYQPVLVFTTIMFPYSCAIPIDTSSDLEHSFDSILSNLVVTRGVRPMVSGFFQSMKQSELGRIMPQDAQGIDWSKKEPQPDTELVRLRKFSDAIHQLYPPDIVEAYSDAILVLETIFAAAARSPKPPSDALLKLWIHFVSPRFMDLLAERQPGALIVFAHYAVLLGRGQHYWFLEGVAERILAIVLALVPSEWQVWLDWPKEHIRADHPHRPT